MVEPEPAPQADEPPDGADVSADEEDDPAEGKDGSDVTEDGSNGKTGNPSARLHGSCAQSRLGWEHRRRLSQTPVAIVPATSAGQRSLLR